MGWQPEVKQRYLTFLMINGHSALSGFAALVDLVCVVNVAHAHTNGVAAAELKRNILNVLGHLLQVRQNLLSELGHLGVQHTLDR